MVMLSIIDTISSPWHWAVSGVLFGLLVPLLTWMGRRFGISTSFEVMCSMMGAGSRFEYFKMDMKRASWRLYLIAGIILGAFIASQFLNSPEPVALSEATIANLASYGIDYPDADTSGRGLLLSQIFNFGNLKGVILAIIGGFFVGFGARYAGGCTSGHAITGLSHLQSTSLVTVIGFFIGGLIMTHLLLPIILF